MLTASDLWYRHRRRDGWVLSGIDLQVAPGEVVGLRGDSGSGKTTLARLLAGYLLPARGRVHVGADGVGGVSSGSGRSGSGRSGSRRSGAARPVQLVLQHPELAVDPRWRLEEILGEAGPIDPALLDALSIAPGWLRRLPHELSGGELQRIAVARALATRPRFLVADEVSAMLDPLTQAQIWAVLRDRVAADGLGLIAISHDGALLDAVADRVVTLADGRLVDEPARVPAAV